jgi:hypothetical protein
MESISIEMLLSALFLSILVVELELRVLESGGFESQEKNKDIMIRDKLVKNRFIITVFL